MWCMFVYKLVKAHIQHRFIQKTKDDKIVKIYNSILEAKRETKLMNIYKVLNGTMNYCGNYKWEYYDKN